MTPALQWDTESYTELLSAKEGHIRETTIYITSALWSEMQEAWGGVVSHVKTATDVPTGEVTMARALATDKGAVAVRQLGALNAVEFSFFRPLHKLNLKVPANRQFNVVPFTRGVPGVGTVYIFPMAQRQSVPRNKKEDAASQSGQKAAAGEQAPAASQE
jgi:hypothetical protein